MNPVLANPVQPHGPRAGKEIASPEEPAGASFISSNLFIQRCGKKQKNTLGRCLSRRGVGFALPWAALLKSSLLLFAAAFPARPVRGAAPLAIALGPARRAWEPRGARPGGPGEWRGAANRRLQPRSVSVMAWLSSGSLTHTRPTCHMELHSCRLHANGSNQCLSRRSALCVSLAGRVLSSSCSSHASFCAK